MAAQSMDNYKTPYNDVNVYLDGSPDIFQNYDYGVNNNNDFSTSFPAEYDSGQVDSENSRNGKDLRGSYHKSDGYDYDNGQADDPNGQDNFDPELDRDQGGGHFESHRGYQNSNNSEPFHENSGNHGSEFNDDHVSHPGYKESGGEEASRSHEDPESGVVDSYENENSGGDENGEGDDGYQAKGDEYDKGKAETADYEDSPRNAKSPDDFPNHFFNTMKKNFAQDFQNDAFFANHKPTYGTHKQPHRTHNNFDNEYKPNQASTRYRLYEALRMREPLNTISTAYLYHPQLTQDSLIGSLDMSSPFASSFIQPQNLGQSLFNTLASPQFEEFYTSPQFANEFGDYKVITRK